MIQTIYHFSGCLLGAGHQAEQFTHISVRPPATRIGGTILSLRLRMKKARLREVQNFLRVTQLDTKLGLDPVLCGSKLVP